MRPSQRFSEKARHTLPVGHRGAEARGQSCIGTEHLSLGLPAEAIAARNPDQAQERRQEERRLREEHGAAEAEGRRRLR